jgi:hypothetical protein
MTKTPPDPGAGQVDPEDACLRVLRDAAPEPLHWTLIVDRVARARLIDPFTTPDVRGVVIKTLATLAKKGRILKEGTGVYRALDEET